jgi:glycosyltransferase involved in cell wall biosynthesis
LIVGIDASRNRSGGAKAHIIGILSELEPGMHGITEVHVWAYDELVAMIPENKWLIKHSPKELSSNLLVQLYWQRFKFHNCAQEYGCDFVLNTDAGTVSIFRPSITMSRDALSYEKGEINRYGFSKSRLRLIVLRYIQNHSLKNSDGSIFLTKYISNLIQTYTGNLNRVKVIPHGLASEFKNVKNIDWPNDDSPIKLLYVSNIAVYKHQWSLVRAVYALRNMGFNLELTLAGGSDFGVAQQYLDDALAECDPSREYVKQVGHINVEDLPDLISASHIFIFASSCETISNTLIEGMASGLPIACSNRGPLPEVLKDAGTYFDPEIIDSIVSAIEQILTDTKLRKNIAAKAKKLSENYSWKRCANETFSFVIETYNEVKK